ncbi:MAG: GLPGLI family protein [Sediminibacterium sp.]
MRQPVYFVVFFLVCATQTLSQPKNMYGRTTYIYTLRTSLYIKGSANTVDTTMLYFNDTSSVYVVNDKYIINEKKILQSLGDNMSLADKQQAIDGIKAIMAPRKQNYMYHKGGSDIISRLSYDPFNKPYCNLDTIPEFGWELLPDTTRMLGFLCQKAVCKSAILGNMYSFIAWYTPDLPVSCGPLKFFGLPGLILEIESQYYNFKAIAVKLPLPPVEQVTINCCAGLPFMSKKEADAISKKAYNEMMDMRKLRNN